jgi:hypothetical protein
MCSFLVGTRTVFFISCLLLYCIRDTSSTFVQMTFKFSSYPLENVQRVEYNALLAILFREIIAGYCENYMERADKFRRKNAEFFSVAG